MLELSWMIILELRDASSVIWFNWLAHLWNIKPLIIVYLEMEKRLKIVNLKDKKRTSVIGNHKVKRQDFKPLNYWDSNTWILRKMFTRDLKEFVELLIKQRVEYLIIGGYAVGVHGHPR